MSVLTIISHTEHYRNGNGEIVGLGSTVTEINNLLEIFDEIIHVAMLHDSEPPPSAMPYISNKIKFRALPAVGGSKITDKFSLILKAPLVLKIIKNALKNTDYFQFRAPTGIGVFVIPYLILFSSKKGWFKYAGNWKQEHAPIAYRFQRWLLKNQRRKVTINGMWDHQPKQCLTFENPCLTSEELKLGKEISGKKSIKNTGVNLCFVGRLEKEKGLDLLLDTLFSLGASEKSQLNTIHIVGHGKHIEDYKKRTVDSGLNFVFHGWLSRKAVHNIYSQSHAIVLPSASEGFPKVIAEAMNYACLPIVSHVSSIGQYVKDEVNGFTFYPITDENLVVNIRKLLELTEVDFSKMKNAQSEALKKFTFSYYNKRILNEIIELR